MNLYKAQKGSQKHLGLGLYKPVKLIPYLSKYRCCSI